MENKEYTVSFHVVISANNAENLTRNPRKYTDAVFRVLADRIKDQGFAVSEAKITELPSVF